MRKAGLFRDERVELLEGEVIAMPPQDPPHASTVQVLAQRLSRVLGDRFWIRCQLPLALDPWSEPEPDVAICELVPDAYAREHPEPAQVQLVVEIADSTLVFDRGRKSSAYARAGIPELWIVDVKKRRIEVRTEPDAARGVYTRTTLPGADDDVEAPGGIRVSVADLFAPV